MWSKPTKADLEKLAKNRNRKDTGSTDDTIILAHFWLQSCDWYIVDYDPETEIMFGYAILNGDLQMSEWGTVFYQGDTKNPASRDDNLMMLKQGFVEVDFDKHWTPKPFREVREEFTRRYGG